MAGLSLRIWWLTAASALAFAASPARAQEEPETAAAPAQARDTDAQGRVFLPEDFARFAPRTALDLLDEVPGFQIESEDGDRGLGQASGNVLINGQRLSSKSESARDQLSRISVDNVVRIEIVDGTSLDIPGLTGQVANVVVEGGGLSGQFEYAPQFREIGGPAFLNGSMSISGASGNFDYQVALDNRDDVGASRGPTLRFDADGNVIEQRFNDNERRDRSPKISANVGWRSDGGVIANATASHRWTFFRSRSDELRSDGDGGDVRIVDRATEDDFVRYEVGGDVAFSALGGRLKLIGLASGDDSDFVSTELLAREADGSLTGARFAQVRDSGERIGRAEFTWSGGAADWQVAAEAAFNTLGQVARLFEVDPGGDFLEIDFPAGVGGVSEDRYEASLSYGRPLSEVLSLQATAAVERSTLTQTGVAAASRTFVRPKGSVSLAWAPQDDLDITLSARRRVGQLQFGDFLARVFLGDDRENAGNNELRPPQSWEFEIEARKGFGRWGNATLRVFDYRIEDLVDVILVDGGQSPGNIESARRFGIELNGTLELAPLGLGGAKIDAEFDWQRARLDDPLTGLARAISGADPYRIDVDFRHDIPGSLIAYGASVFLSGDEPFFRITENGFERNGPAFGGIFVEHKDLFGLTVNVRVGNPYLGGDRSIRTVFDGPRNAAPILFVEERDRQFGRSVRVSIKGSF
jgi:hypothetical protein